MPLTTGMGQGQFEPELPTFKMTDAECAERLLNRVARSTANHLDNGDIGAAKTLLPVYRWLAGVAGEDEG